MNEKMGLSDWVYAITFIFGWSLIITGDLFGRDGAMIAGAILVAITLATNAWGDAQ